MHRLHIVEDRIGVRRLFQRLAFLDSLESIVQAIENVANRAFAGKFFLRVLPAGVKNLRTPFDFIGIGDGLLRA